MQGENTPFAFLALGGINFNIHVRLSNTHAGLLHIFNILWYTKCT